MDMLSPFIRILLACTLIGVCQPAGAAPAPPERPANPALEQSLRAQLDELRARFAQVERPSELGPHIDRLMDLAIAYCLPAGDTALIPDINTLRRQIRQLGQLRPDQVAAIKPVIIADPRLSGAVCNALGPRDNVAAAYATLAMLKQKFGDRMAPPSGPGAARLAPTDSLVAAMCVVHDDPSAKPERAAELFDFFLTNWSRLECGEAPGFPPEVMVHIVSTPVSLDELNWALKNYRGNRQVGKLYSTIVYDTGAFKYGREKKVMSQPGGYTLMNIRKVGGVCVEQAYFASNVARAIGVPAVSVSARGSDVGHAWVGYLKGVGSNRWEWDFDEGRYKEYQGLRGDVTDPQTGQTIADGYVGATAGLISPKVDRANAIAMLDAAERLAAIEVARSLYPPTLSAGEPQPEGAARPLGFESQLALIEAGLRACPPMRRGWDQIAQMAENGRLNPEQINLWSERAYDLCGDDHPDFAFLTLAPMIRAIRPYEAQDSRWDWLHGRYNRRKDLAAAARFEQGRMWEQAGNQAKAWEMYTQCIERYPNDGQIIVEALRHARQLLEKQGNRGQPVIDLYAGAWGRISKPRQMSTEFAAGSTYVTVGKVYAGLLEAAGDAKKAKQVRDAVASAEGRD